MALDATVGGATANSYLTLAAAESYMLGRLSVDDWDAADEHEKEAALIMATGRLEAESFVGSVFSTTQRLQWPRYGASDRNGRALSSASIPQLLQDATCELALSLLGDPGMLGSTSGLTEFANLRLGSLDVTPRGGSMNPLPMTILRLIAPLRVSGFGAPVVRA